MDDMDDDEVRSLKLVLLSADRARGRGANRTGADARLRVLLSRTTASNTKDPTTRTT